MLLIDYKFQVHAGDDEQKFGLGLRLYSVVESSGESTLRLAGLAGSSSVAVYDATSDIAIAVTTSQAHDEQDPLTAVVSVAAQALGVGAAVNLD